jgi:hypothetical protein
METELKDLLNTHKLLALANILTEEQVKQFNIPGRVDNYSDGDLCRIGLVHFNERELNFNHRTFAEYLVAKYVVKMFRNKDPGQEVRNFLETIFLEGNFAVVRTFVNNALKKITLPQKVSKIHGESMKKYGCIKKEDGVEDKGYWDIILEKATKENHTFIIRFVFSNLQESGHLEAMKQLLISNNGSKDHPAIMIATKLDRIDCLVELWEWCKICFSEALSKFILHSLFCLASYYQLFEAMDKVWAFAEGIKEIERMLLVDQVRNNLPPDCPACYCGIGSKFNRCQCWQINTSSAFSRGLYSVCPPEIEIKIRVS